MRRSLSWGQVLPVILLSFWLGAHNLDVRPLWNDEAYSVYSIGGSAFGPLTLAEVWQRVATEDPWQAPGYSLALHGWMRVVGDDPVALRVFSLLVGMLAIAWTYRLGSDIGGGRVGLYAAIILATSVIFVHYLREMRVYTLLTMATAYTIWMYHRVTTLRGRPRLLHWLGLLSGMVLILYLHYFSAFTLATLGLYHLLFARRVAAWKPMFGVFAAAGVLFLPWLQAFFAGLELLRIDDDLSTLALPNDQLLLMLLNMLANGVLPLLVVSLVPLIRVPWQRLRAVLFWFVGILALILLANGLLALIPPSRLRYFLLLWPVFAVLAALGIAATERWTRFGRWLPALLIVAWAGSGLLNSTNRDLTARIGGIQHTYPMQHIARAVAADRVQNDLLLNFLPDVGTNFGFHFRAANIYYDPLDVTWMFIRSNPSPHNWNERTQVPADVLEGRRRIWTAWMPGQEPEALPEFLPTLETRYALCYVAQERSNLHLALYTEEAVCCGPSLGDRTLIDYGGLIRLAGVNGLPADVSDYLTITLGWSLAPETPLHVYSVSLQILDIDGEKVAQQDYGLEPRAYICQTSDFDAAGLAPGEYGVYATVYAWESGARLPATAADGATGELIRIGTFHVVE